MKRSKERHRRPETGRPDEGAPLGATGRQLVLLRQGAGPPGIKALTSKLGIKAASASDFADGAVDVPALGGADALLFPELGVAVVDLAPDQMPQLDVLAADDSGVLGFEPERTVFAVDEAPAGRYGAVAGTEAAGLVVAVPGLPFQGGFLRGYRDGVNDLVDRVVGGNGHHGTNGKTALAEPQVGQTFVDTPALTWGLQAIGVENSPFSGKGVKVAVLDTGLDLGHPDFAGRQITSQSFVAGQTPQDGHGHGTHGIGTACGPKQPSQGPRYGIAFGTEIFAGKVLSDAGSGTDGAILAGLNWAVTNQCAVILLMMGAPTQPGQAFSLVFETVARRALATGAVILAASGGESSRPGLIAPVGHPANCPSIMAVGALDQQLGVASFSPGGINPNGGQVDLAAPGVQVRSSWPRPRLFRTISGSTCAAAHVAGIAALLAEENPDQRGGSLGWLLLQSARRLNLLSRDVGAGLVQAPVR